jgi:putative nucleotidyltransferase with HDIG domain
VDLQTLEIKLARATTLPLLPGATLQILSLSDNADATARDYERLISQDAAMASKILRTANSPYFCGSREITSIQRALIQLGVNQVRSVCLATAFQSSLASKKLDRRFDATRYWQHCLAVACASKVIARLTNSKQVEEAFVAGMLHDIGKLAIALYFPAELGQIVQFSEANQVSHYESEQRRLGVTHQEIGELAAQKWSLPDLFLQPIRYHHNPIDMGRILQHLTAVVHVANALSYDIDFGFSPVCQEGVPIPEVKAFLGIPEAQYTPIRTVIAKEVCMVGKQFGL